MERMGCMTPQLVTVFIMLILTVFSTRSAFEYNLRATVNIYCGSFLQGGTFDVPEVVPFRLTHNMAQAMVSTSYTHYYTYNIHVQYMLSPVLFCGED